MMSFFSDIFFFFFFFSSLLLRLQSLAKLKAGEVIQLVRRGFFRVDSEHKAPGQPLHLFLIPDGKTKSMSTLSSALPHQ